MKVSITDMALFENLYSADTQPSRKGRFLWVLVRVLVERDFKIFADIFSYKNIKKETKKSLKSLKIQGFKTYTIRDSNPRHPD